MGRSKYMKIPILYFVVIESSRQKNIVMLWLFYSVFTTRAPGSVAAGLTESISPATSWISLASIARSLARSWLILMNKHKYEITIWYMFNQFFLLFGDIYFIHFIQELITIESIAQPKTKENNENNVIPAIHLWAGEACLNTVIMTHHCSALEYLSPTYLAISSLCAVQSLIYSSCSLECGFWADRPAGLGVAGAEPPNWATRVEGNGRAWPCLYMWRFEPYSSSDVEAYSTGTRRHRVPANIREEWKLSLDGA